MKWLVAALLPAGRVSPRLTIANLICERGTAILREGPARALFDLSGGRIKTCYTEMQGGTRLIWEEKKTGNSKGKAPLESFHNYAKNQGGSLPGQTGIEHERQPATLPAQLRETRDLLSLAALMAPEERRQLQHTLLTFEEAVQALGRIYKRANERKEHNLEGVERDVIGWRLSAGHPWTWLRELPAEVQALSRVPGFEVQRRKPCPLELKKRLKEGQAFIPVPEWAWPLFFDHTQKVGKIVGLEFSFQRDNREFIFWPDDRDPGALTMAADLEKRGEKLLGYYNDRDPERLYLTPRGRRVRRHLAARPACLPRRPRGARRPARQRGTPREVCPARTGAPERRGAGPACCASSSRTDQPCNGRASFPRSLATASPARSWRAPWPPTGRSNVASRPPAAGATGGASFPRKNIPRPRRRTPIKPTRQQKPSPL